MSARHDSGAVLAEWEQAEIKRANESGLVPVVFVHGLWLLSSSWQKWRELFETNGYTTVAPGWPDDPATVQEARANPDVFAHKKFSRSQITISMPFRSSIASRPLSATRSAD